MQKTTDSFDRIGIEIEFQLLDEDTLDLADRIGILMKRLGDDPRISSEVFQSCIELKTSPVKNTQEAEQELHEILQKVMAHLPDLKLKLCSLGVHPFSTRVSATTPKERYLAQENE